MTVINPHTGIIQQAVDLTAERAAEIYETTPDFLRGTSISPFIFTPSAGTVVNGGGGPTVALLPYVMPASLLSEWTPYIDLKRNTAGAAAITVTISFLCSPGSDTYTFPMMDGTLPVPALHTIQLDTEAGGGTAWGLYRLQPILGTDGFIGVVASNPGAAAPADNITIRALAIWRP